MVENVALEGMTLTIISRQLFMSKYSVSKIHSRYNERGHVEKSWQPKEQHFVWIEESNELAKEIHGCQNQE